MRTQEGAFILQTRDVVAVKAPQLSLSTCFRPCFHAENNKTKQNTSEDPNLNNKCIFVAWNLYCCVLSFGLYVVLNTDMIN